MVATALSEFGKHVVDIIPENVIHRTIKSVRSEKLKPLFRKQA